MFKIKKNLEIKFTFSKIIFYFMLICLGFIFYLMQQKIVGDFISSYLLLEFLNFLFNNILEKLKKNYKRNKNKRYFVDIIYLVILLIILLVNEEFVVIFTFLGMVFYIMFQYELYNPLKYFTIKDKIILGGYLFYSIVVLIIKIILKLDNDSYMTFQLVYFSKVFDYFKDKLTNGIVGGNLKIVDEFEKLNKKNNNQEQKLSTITLIDIWEKALEFDDKEEVKSTVLQLSETNKKFLKEMMKELDSKINKTKKSKEITKKQIKKLEKIVKRKVNKNEIPILEFMLYKTDAEKILRKVGN